MTSTPKQKFHHLQGYIDDATATKLYRYIHDNVAWGAGIKTRTGKPTRLAAPLDLFALLVLLDDFPEVTAKIIKIITDYSTRPNCIGVYINYYRDGTDYTPSHTHKDTTQIVVSLGATRTFTYVKKEVESRNGDVLIFGASAHGVPKDESVTEGRISIALFMMK